VVNLAVRDMKLDPGRDAAGHPPDHDASCTEFLPDGCPFAGGQEILDQESPGVGHLPFHALVDPGVVLIPRLYRVGTRCSRERSDREQERGNPCQRPASRVFPGEPIAKVVS